MLKQLWWMKHRPDTLDNFIFQNEEHERKIKKYIEDKSIPHLLLYGVKGSGKTTLARILINALVAEEHRAADVLYIDGSSEGNIENIRTTLINHVTSVPMGDIKLVFIDEADGLSSSAQNALRGILEKHQTNARVIFTANYINKLTVELRDRFTELKFTALNKKKILGYCIGMLDEEGVDIENPENIKVLKQLYDINSSTFRQLITALQDSHKDDKIILDDAAVDDSLHHKLELIELINKDNWMKARELVASNFPDQELVEVYRFLYDYLEDIEKFTKDPNKWKRGIVTISDYMYRHATHPDQEINFASCLIRLSEI